ncbi:conserved exported hypothetical protein [Flavobacterium sp. 9AF]|uniref:TolC family protein n=1 Tax=Flavobacterium sp. 9AF TaxID=2653142 RepID=UPI0012F46AA0|nr:TolC family protein [Flavobacterium sp. 9AF]VXB24581.1 conserved exported hypothetical protein [Flavobacterium sp. 9AF]
MSRLFLLSFLLVKSLFVNGQEQSWSLQKCIDTALKNSIETKIKQLEIKKIKKTNVSLLNEMLPTVNLFGSQSYNFGSTIDPATNGRVSSNIQYDNFYLNAQMNLLNFNSITNAQKNNINIKLAQAEKEIIENEYKLQILDSYYQALITQELLKIQKKQIENLKNNLARISEEVDLGSKPKSDLYDMELLFLQEEKKIIETNQLLNLNKAALFQLMNDTVYPINEVYLEIEVEIQEFQYNFNNPKISFAKFNHEKSTIERNSLRANNLPTLSAFYQISSFYYKPLNHSDNMIEGFENQLKNNKNQQFGIQLNVPLFNGFKNNKKINAAKIEEEQHVLKIEQEKQKLENQLLLENEKEANYIVLQKKLNEILILAQKTFTTTQSKFVLGKTDAYTFSMAKNNLLLSEYEVLKNNLQIQYTHFKKNLIEFNQL